MISKEKAKELYDKFVHCLPDSGDISKQDVQQCCIIAVDEVIGYGYKPEFPYKYWEEVKKEIESL